MTGGLSACVMWAGGHTPGSEAGQKATLLDNTEETIAGRGAGGGEETPLVFRQANK